MNLLHFNLPFLGSQPECAAVNLLHFNLTFLWNSPSVQQWTYCSSELTTFQALHFKGPSCSSEPATFQPYLFGVPAGACSSELTTFQRYILGVPAGACSSELTTFQRYILGVPAAACSSEPATFQPYSFRVTDRVCSSELTTFQRYLLGVPARVCSSELTAFQLALGVPAWVCSSEFLYTSTLPFRDPSSSVQQWAYHTSTPVKRRISGFVPDQNSKKRAPGRWTKSGKGARRACAIILPIFCYYFLIICWCLTFLVHFSLLFFLLSTNNSARIVKVKNAQKK